VNAGASTSCDGRPRGRTSQTDRPSAADAEVGRYAAVRAWLTIALVLVALQVVLLGGEWLSAGRPPATEGVARLRVEPNRASVAELMLLPRIGPQLAAAIVAHRESAPVQPAFRCADDLRGVRRIGPALVNSLRPHLTFGGEP